MPNSAAGLPEFSEEHQSCINTTILQHGMDNLSPSSKENGRALVSWTTDFQKLSRLGSAKECPFGPREVCCVIKWAAVAHAVRARVLAQLRGAAAPLPWLKWPPGVKVQSFGSQLGRAFLSTRRHPVVVLLGVSRLGPSPLGRANYRILFA